MRPRYMTNHRKDASEPGIRSALEEAGALKASIKAGYRRFAMGGRWVYEHVLVAERALGKSLPKGAHVHHVNEDKLDNRPSNLVICPDGAYHRLLHVRADAYDACGNPDWRMCYCCRKYDDPKNLYKKPRGGQWHRECENAIARERRRKARIARGGPERGREILDDEKVRSIRQRLKDYKHGLYQTLGAEYGVCATVISGIHRNKWWRHVV